MRTVWRRIVGLGTMVFLAHASTAASDLVCALPTASPAASHAAMADMASMDSRVDGMSAVGNQDAGACAVSAATGTDDAPCQAASMEHCCVMAGCSSTLAAAGVTSAQLFAAAEGVADATGFAPASRLTAPEPPPPKA